MEVVSIFLSMILAFTSIPGYYTRNYIPPPADELAGYYFYDNSDFYKYKKNMNPFQSDKMRYNNRFPVLFGNMKYTLYTTPFKGEIILYEYKIVCLATYLCINKDKRVYHKTGKVTNMELEHISFVSAVNIFKFVLYGDPE